MHVHSATLCSPFWIEELRAKQVAAFECLGPVGPSHGSGALRVKPGSPRWQRVAPRHLHPAGRPAGAPVAGRTAPAGATAPKKNKRGTRSKEKQEKRIQKGIQKRLEALQERAEAQYPELVGQASSSRGSASGATRTVVLQERSKETDFEIGGKPKQTKEKEVQAISR